MVEGMVQPSSWGFKRRVLSNEAVLGVMLDVAGSWSTGHWRLDVKYGEASNENGRAQSCDVVGAQSAVG